MSETPSPVPVKPPVSIPWLISLTVLICCVTVVARLRWIEPSFPAIVPKGTDVLPFAAIFAFGLAVVITLALANRRRWRVVLWHNTGRLIGAFALAFVTPFVIFSWIPGIFGVLVLGVVVDSSADTWRSMAIGVPLLAALTAFWYPISCLIVSGLASRWARVGVFCLMFWSAYSAIILVVGNQIFRL